MYCILVGASRSACDTTGRRGANVPHNFKLIEQQSKEMSSQVVRRALRVVASRAEFIIVCVNCFYLYLLYL